MIKIVLYYTKDIYDVFNIEDGYIIIEDKKYSPTIEYHEDHNLFTFVINKENTYTVKVNLDNKFYDCFTQPLYLNKELIDPLMYYIDFEEIDKSYSIDEDEDSYG